MVFSFLRFLLAALLAFQSAFVALAQSKAQPVPTTPKARTPADFGYRHLVVRFGQEDVDVLVQSKKGEESVRKPLLLWVQGSLPRPLILLDSLEVLRVFPFATRAGADSLAATCHLAIISKPGIPLVAELKDLGAGASFVDKTTHIPPAYYCERNYLDYYVHRSTAVLRYLKKQPWVEAEKVTVAGHSEGTTIVAHLAAVPGLVSRAVYLSGNPLGRMLSIIADDRQAQAAGDTAAVAEGFRWWRTVMANPKQGGCTPGDNNRTTSSFSAAPLPELLKARVPLFIGYGTRDKAVLSDDYLRLEAMRLHKANFTFREYVGREHNFFRLGPDGKPDYDDDYWPAVGRQFLRWAGLLPSASQLRK
jgi:dienelactone hydrolase